jgi:hypothetical protein
MVWGLTLATFTRVHVGLTIVAARRFHAEAVAGV